METGIKGLDKTITDATEQQNSAYILEVRDKYTYCVDGMKNKELVSWQFQICRVRMTSLSVRKHIWLIKCF